MLSRVAEAIYWMARNVERVDNIARFIEVTQDFVLDMPGVSDRQWLPLVYVTGEEAFFLEHFSEANARTVTEFLVLCEDYHSSMTRLITIARENGRSVRETIASEMWEELNNFYQWFRVETAAGQPWRAPSEFFRAVMQHAVLFHGVTDATMTRDDGWHFVNLGRQLERADQISRLLDVKYFTLLPNAGDVNTPVDQLQWGSLLRSVSGFEMYRKLHHEITVPHVIEFMVLNRRFPRAVHHCLSEANRSLHAITGCPIGEFCNPAEQTLGRLCADLAYTDASTIINRGLHEFVDDLQMSLNAVGDAIFEAFFAIKPTPDARTADATDDAAAPAPQLQTQN